MVWWCVFRTIATRTYTILRVQQTHFHSHTPATAAETNSYISTHALALAFTQTHNTRTHQSQTLEFIHSCDFINKIRSTIVRGGARIANALCYVRYAAWRANSKI